MIYIGLNKEYGYNGEALKFTTVILEFYYRHYFNFFILVKTSKIEGSPRRSGRF